MNNIKNMADDKKIIFSMVGVSKAFQDVYKRQVLAFFWADNSLNSSLRDNIPTMMQGLQTVISPKECQNRSSGMLLRNHDCFLLTREEKAGCQE